MTSVGRVAPLDHSRRSFADGARGPQLGAGLKQLYEPTRAQSRALRGKAPERGCERRINWTWLVKDSSAWRIRLLLAPWCMSQRTVYPSRSAPPFQLGSIAAISDAPGAVIECLAFDPWGKCRFIAVGPLFMY